MIKTSKSWQERYPQYATGKKFGDNTIVAAYGYKCIYVECGNCGCVIKRRIDTLSTKTCAECRRKYKRYTWIYGLEPNLISARLCKGWTWNEAIGLVPRIHQLPKEDFREHHYRYIARLNESTYDEMKAVADRAARKAGVLK